MLVNIEDKIKYHDSALGIIPKEWKICSIEDAMEKIIDYRGKTPSKTSKGIPLITAKIVKNGRIQEPTEFIAEDDYDTWMRRGLPKKGDVVMTTEAPLGEIAQLDDRKVALAQRIITFRGKNGVIDNTFLRYLMQSKRIQAQLNGRATGSTVSGIKQKELRKVLLLCPPFLEQKAIAAVLSSLDDKIELLQKQNQTLENIAQTLFKRWFVDFEFPDEKGKPYKSSGGKMVESEMGEIPNGWKLRLIGEMVETLGGGTPSTSEKDYWQDGNILWYSPTDLTKKKSLFSFNTDKKITTEGLKNSSAKIFPRYSLLMTSRATLGEIAVNVFGACTNQGFITIIPSQILQLPYLHNWLKLMRKRIESLASGSTFLEISKSNFRKLDILIPSESILENYYRLTWPHYKKIEGNLSQIRILTKIRDTLLPKLMSGEVRIKIQSK